MVTRRTAPNRPAGALAALALALLAVAPAGAARAAADDARLQVSAESTGAASARLTFRLVIRDGLRVQDGRVAADDGRHPSKPQFQAITRQVDGRVVTTLAQP